MNVRAWVRERLARRMGVPEIAFALERLARNGLQPASVFDVGAYRGDFARLCLQLWPQAHVSCFEVQEPRVRELHELAGQTRQITVFPCLLGEAAKAEVPLHLAETASSVLVEQSPQAFPTRNFPMRTVDEIVTVERHGQSPDLLKLDVQGYELAVLKGAEQSLTGTRALLVEVNLLDLHAGVPLHGEMTAWLLARGWVAYDICGLTRRPLDGALWQADFLFVPEASPLRSDKRWNT